MKRAPFPDNSSLQPIPFQAKPNISGNVNFNAAQQPAFEQSPAQPAANTQSPKDNGAQKSAAPNSGTGIYPGTQRNPANAGQAAGIKTFMNNPRNLPWIGAGLAVLILIFALLIKFLKNSEIKK